MSDKVYSQPVLAYRAWCYKNGVLYSIGQGATRWRPGINVSYCKHASHDAPAQNCHCGFNAFHTYEQTQDYIQKWRQGIKGPVVIGLVALRGQLEIHHTGVRAEEAIVLGLIEEGEAHLELDEVALRYDVPVLSHNELLERASSVAAVVPMEDRPLWSEPKQKQEKQERQAGFWGSHWAMAMHFSITLATISASLAVVYYLYGHFSAITYAATGCSIAWAIVVWFVLTKIDSSINTYSYIWQKVIWVALYGSFIVGFSYMDVKSKEDLSQQASQDKRILEPYQAKYNLQNEEVGKPDMGTWNCYKGSQTEQPVLVCLDSYDKTVRVITEPYVR